MLKDCDEKRFDSVGYGQDYRYEGRDIVGSVLVHENVPVHMAFFAVTRSEKDLCMKQLNSGGLGKISMVNRRQVRTCPVRQMIEKNAEAHLKQWRRHHENICTRRVGCVDCGLFPTAP